MQEKLSGRFGAGVHQRGEADMNGVTELIAFRPSTGSTFPKALGPYRVNPAGMLSGCALFLRLKFLVKNFWWYLND